MNLAYTKLIKSLSASKLLMIGFVIAIFQGVLGYILIKLQFKIPIFDGYFGFVIISLITSFVIWLIFFIPIKNKLKSLFLLEQELDAIDNVSIISTSDLSGKITFANKYFCQISGYSKDELMNKDHRILNSGFHPKSYFINMWQTLSSGKTWQGKICNKKKNGEIYWVDSYIVPIFDSFGKPKLYISFRFDITAEKIAEEALEQEKFKMIHLSRLSAIGEMSGGIAHEINNPLTIVKSSLQLMAKKLQMDNQLEEIPKVLESIEKAQSQISRISKIVNGLREFSRSGDKLQNEKVTSLKILESVTDLCFEKLKKQNVNLETTKNEIEFECNIVQIEQVLVNLINNSIDAISPLAEKWIKVEATVIGNNLEFYIIDSGNGITEEMAQKIMQPFFTTKEVGKGTGLGLSISRGILEKHGGELFPDTQSKNTRFVIRLPLTKAP
jgi:PAS domain S-box-containing protein